MNQSLLAWSADLVRVNSIQTIRDACVAIRANCLLEAEAYLLTSSHVDAQRLLLHLRLVQNRPRLVVDILNGLEDEWFAHPFSRYLRVRAWLMHGYLDQLGAIPVGYWVGIDSEPLLALAYGCWLLGSGDISAAQALLHSNLIPDSPERALFNARVLKRQGRWEKGIQVLEQAVDRDPTRISLQQQLLFDLLDANQLPTAISRLRQALELHGEVYQFLSQVVTVKLLQRQPGRARRAALICRLKSECRGDNASQSNQLITYEQTGHANWLEHLWQPLHISQDPNLLANMVMQMASVESPQAQDYAIRFVQLMKLRNETMGLYGAPFTYRVTDASTSLRVLWMTADICDHPVGRFLYGFFAASQDNHMHEHIVVSWSSPQDNPFHGYFRSLRGVQFMDVNGYSASELYRFVRDLEADIAIDLTGWTAKNYGNGFLARLAPLQMNYLGYYASTGNPSIDIWLGDEALFPMPIQEWHTESIHRLSRCFIAWQPPAELPEAQLDVSLPPLGHIRFGSFNHNRKISDSVLSLWGRILRVVPNSQLVLKATAPGDEQTLELLKRRMARHGLDVNRVLWLPLVKDNRDHLLQYAEIDVALDTFPNGGCTTTFEALWMGVPVITLTGRSYVSRMSTAVLHGAGLPEWCVSTQDHYLELAVACAGRLNYLRQNRGHWRHKLVTSKIGDAADLMQHLELAFSQLYRQYSLADANMR